MTTPPSRCKLKPSGHHSIATGEAASRLYLREHYTCYQHAETMIHVTSPVQGQRSPLSSTATNETAAHSLHATYAQRATWSHKCSNNIIGIQWLCVKAISLMAGCKQESGTAFAPVSPELPLPTPPRQLLGE